MSVEMLPDVLPILELALGGGYRPAPGDGLPPDQATAWARQIDTEIEGGRTAAIVFVGGEEVQIGLVRPPMPGPKFEIFVASLDVEIIFGVYLAEPTPENVVLDASTLAATSEA